MDGSRLASKCLAVDGSARSTNGGASRCRENDLVSSVSGLMEENREPLANWEIGDGARQQTPGLGAFLISTSTKPHGRRQAVNKSVKIAPTFLCLILKAHSVPHAVLHQEIECTGVVLPNPLRMTFTPR